ncbi:hypothetical protein DFJ73DRAFT_905073 [Zopfochytrium polystomum]|nr:hypothetical protein DFJ73DRAFT_905073 [Zopfochytrium polystomum]
MRVSAILSILSVVASGVIAVPTPRKAVQQAAADYDELSSILDTFVDATRQAAVSENLFDGQSITFDDLQDDDFQDAVAQEITNRAIEYAFPDEESRARLAAAFDNDEFKDEVQSELADTFADIFSYVDGEKVSDMAADMMSAEDELVEDDAALDEEEFDDETAVDEEELDDEEAVDEDAADDDYAAVDEFDDEEAVDEQEFDDEAAVDEQEFDDEEAADEEEFDDEEAVDEEDFADSFDDEEAVDEEEVDAEDKDQNEMAVEDVGGEGDAAVDEVEDADQVDESGVDDDGAEGFEEDEFGGDGDETRSLFDDDSIGEFGRGGSISSFWTPGGWWLHDPNYGWGWTVVSREPRVQAKAIKTAQVLSNDNKTIVITSDGSNMLNDGSSYIVIRRVRAHPPVAAVVAVSLLFIIMFSSIWLYWFAYHEPYMYYVVSTRNPDDDRPAPEAKASSSSASTHP